MIQKLNILLFYPRFIGKYITDSFIRVILFFVVLLSLVTIVSFLNVDMNSGMSSARERNLISQIGNIDQDSGLAIYEGLLIGTGEHTIVLDSQVTFNFFPGITDGQSFPTPEINAVNFNFLNDRVIINVSQIFVATYYFDDLLLRDFNFADVTSDFTARFAFLVFMNNAFNIYLQLNAPITFINILIFTTTVWMFTMIFIYILTSRHGMFIRGGYRVKLIAYASTWILVTMLLQEMFRISGIEFIGFIVAYIFATKALKSIVKIETRYKK